MQQSEQETEQEKIIASDVIGGRADRVVRLKNGKLEIGGVDFGKLFTAGERDEHDKFELSKISRQNVGIWSDRLKSIGYLDDNISPISDNGKIAPEFLDAVVYYIDDNSLRGREYVEVSASLKEDSAGSSGGNGLPAVAATDRESALKEGGVDYDSYSQLSIDRGSHSFFLEAIQQYLSDAGVLKGGVDQLIGPETDRALKEIGIDISDFDKSLGQRGFLEAVEAALKEYTSANDAPSADGQVEDSPPEGSGPEDQSDTPFGSGIIVFSPELPKSDQVESFQRWVNDSFGWGITEDGEVGPETMGVVIAMQKAFNEMVDLGTVDSERIAEDGLLGLESRDALIENMEAIVEKLKGASKPEPYYSLY